jgi:predicted AAA+ superfamily ATPase
MGDVARRYWLESYVDHLVTRDAAQVESGRDPARLRRYLEAYALNTAGVVEERTLLEAAGINRRTAQAYERLLGSLLVIESLPAWSSNRLKRLVLTPKRHLVDPGLVVGVLRLDVDHVLRDGDLLGRLLDSFVVAQLRAELPVAETRPRLYHLRQQQGRIEVDVVAELAGGGIVGIEVKATAAPGPPDARHLATLRDAESDRFVAGVVLHSGPRAFRLGDRIWAAPISSLWGS